MAHKNVSLLESEYNLNVNKFLQKKDRTGIVNM